MSVIAGLQQSGPGDVLVVAAGSDEHAVAGELFATEALRRGVAGIVIDGLCRDSRTLAELDLPVYARGVRPTACPARAVPVVQVPIMIGWEVSASGRFAARVTTTVWSWPPRRRCWLSLTPQRPSSDAKRRWVRRSAAGSSLFDSLNYDEHVAAVRAGRGSRLTFS